MRATDDTNRPDTRDMVVVHGLFRRELRLLPELVRGCAEGDRRRITVIADHLRLLMTFLTLHHTGEDRVLWPKLRERVPQEVAPTVELMEQQHERIHTLVGQIEGLVSGWEQSASAVDRDRLADSLTELSTAVEEHLSAEEERILPLAEKCLTAAEWHQLGEEGMQAMDRRKMPLVMGMMMYETDPAVIKSMLAHAPRLPRVLMPLLGPRAFARYARRVHGTPRP